MKIYLVAVIPHGEIWTFIGCYSTETKAHDAANAYAEKHPPYSLAWRPSIEVFTLDETRVDED